MAHPEKIDHHRAMQMLNSTLQEMKKELGEVEGMSLKGPKKKMAHHMHEIYEEISDLVSQYSETHQHDDLNHVFRQIEILKPAFILNYNEILR